MRTYCGVPLTAQAITINVTAVAPSTDGYMIVWPYGIAQPGTSTINYAATDYAVANGAVLGLGSDATSQLSVISSAAADVVIDVTGYFQ